MDHREAAALLDDWIDGTLHPERAAEVEAHISRCDACRAEAEELRSLRRAAARLPRSIEPGRDLWPGIAAAIGGDGDVTERPSALRRRRTGRAARLLRVGAPPVAVAAAALLVILLLDGTPPGGGERIAERSPLTETAPIDPAVLRIARAIEEECRSSDREARYYLSRLGGAAPEAVLLIQRDLDDAGRAAEEARDAWLASPESPFLGRCMTEAYRMKAELQGELVRVAALTAAAPGAGAGVSPQGRAPRAEDRSALRST